MKTLTKSRKKILFFVLVVLIITISYFDISTNSNKISLTSKSNLSNVTGIYLRQSHYNLRIGYANFTTNRGNVSFLYVVIPFNGVNPIYVGTAYDMVYNSHNASLASVFAVINVYQISTNSSSNPVSFGLNSFSLKSPQGINGKIQAGVSSTSSNSFGILVYPKGELQSYDPFDNSLGQYPGYHNFFLNFTFTIHYTLGPYKFPFQSKAVHLEYNNTIIT